MKLLKGTTLILAGVLLCSCAVEQKISKQEVAESISDISSDEEGNVSIVLEDGRVFSLCFTKIYRCLDIYYIMRCTPKSGVEKKMI